MDLLPYIEKLGMAGSVVGFALYVWEMKKHDATREKLFQLLPQMATVMTKFQEKLDLITEFFLRDGGRHDPPRKD